VEKGILKGTWILFKNRNPAGNKAGRTGTLERGAPAGLNTFGRMTGHT